MMWILWRLRLGRPNTSEAERIAMGERGKHLIQENYSVEMVAGKLKRLYEWILYGGEKPEFVYLK